VKKIFDLVVIGTGEAGSTVALRCRAEGKQVAIVDSRSFGGTCGLRGCDPKKVLMGAAELVDRRGGCWNGPARPASTCGRARRS
jgi:glutathione reductase (NADPH)